VGEHDVESIEELTDAIEDVAVAEGVLGDD